MSQALFRRDRQQRAVQTVRNRGKGPCAITHGCQEGRVQPSELGGVIQFASRVFTQMVNGGASGVVALPPL